MTAATPDPNVDVDRANAELDAVGQAEHGLRLHMGEPADETPFAIDSAALDMQAELARQDAEQLADDVASLEADATLAQERALPGEMAWLPTWFLGQLTQLDAADAALTAQYLRLQREVESRRKALRWRYGRAMQEQVASDLAKKGGKGKSINYPTGRAGFRTTGGQERVVIDNENMAIGHAETVCPEAVKVSRHLLLTPARQYMTSTGEVIAGTHLETAPKVEKFYAGQMTFEQPQLQGGEGEERKQLGARAFLEPEGDSDVTF